MSNVPQPRKGSVGLKVSVVPRDLSPGFYLDDDVVLKVTEKEVVIIAPDAALAASIAGSLHRTAMSWRGSLVNYQVVDGQPDAYAAWMKLVAKFESAGELEDVSRESEDVAKSVALAAS